MGLAIHTFPFAESESCRKEGTQMTPQHMEELAEQVLDLIFRMITLTFLRWGQDSPFLCDIPMQLPPTFWLP